MNPHYTYLLILVAALAGPLALSFDKKVAFFTKWKFFFPALIFPALFYIVWDIYFTSENIWSFNEKYITGIRFAGLPLEEMLFFLVVPYCCLFIYECIRCYFPELKNKTQGDVVLKVLALVLLLFAVFFRPQAYTFWTFLFTFLFIFLLYTLRSYFKTFDASSFLVSYAVILIPFLIVNGALTMIPVVIYNDSENMGVRIYTIPFEDVFYGLLLTLMLVSLYERRLNRQN